VGVGDDTPGDSTTATFDVSDRSKAPPAVPLRFQDRYVAGGELGRGGMGIVHSYQDRQLGRQVALKILADADAGHAMEFAAKFVEEARLQAQLEHPSIVPVYEPGLNPEERFYFTMKQVRGVTLREIFQRLHQGDPLAIRRWSRRRLLDAIGRVSLAVHFAHERGVLHRDLKPSNVMLGNYGEVYVLDWGIALSADRAREEAEAESRRALAQLENSLGAEHPTVASSHATLGLILAAQGKYEEAEVEHRRALALHEKTLGPEHPQTAESRCNLAEALIERGKRAEAARLAEQVSVALRARDDVSPGQKGRAAFLWARALWDVHADRRTRDRARELAEQAVEDYRAVGPSRSATAEMIEAWIENPQSR
jgi:tRNA A-37 threonylcarbamoyl transferase component Bud32